MNLADCPPSTHLVVTAVTATHAHALRYAELGLHVGAHLHVLMSRCGNRRIIALGTERIAVAPEAARTITVTPHVAAS
ncbi:FeoA family protein [Timonella sp. A28]|uniref:FeoA family protein n=1 Tax=Timonella sp. A28 TaxID=3442640 RepID=UPI003EBD56BB